MSETKEKEGDAPDIPQWASVWVRRGARNTTTKFHTHPQCRHLTEKMRELTLAELREKFHIKYLEECESCERKWRLTGGRCEDYHRGRLSCVVCGVRWFDLDALGDFGVFTDCPECGGELTVTHRPWYSREEDGP